MGRVGAIMWNHDVVNETTLHVLRFEVATDAAEAHSLLCSSDAEQAHRYAIAAPQRNPATTEHRVRSGEVRVARLGGTAVGSFTLCEQAPFDLEPGVFGPARRPLYLSRLCVAPEQLRNGSLVGLKCLREAVAEAERSGADALRSQANPDFTDVLTLLELHGFQRRGPIREHADLRFVNMEKPLAARDSSHRV